MSDGPNSIAETTLRHAGTTGSDPIKVGNLQYIDNTHSHGGYKRSCGKCGVHRSPTGGGRWRGLWVAACCLQKKGGST